MTKFSNYTELKQLVDDKEGVANCTMASLRDAHDAGKLGVHVVAGIEDKLAGLGLGHSNLSANQHDVVRIYKKGSRVGGLIEAAHDLSESANQSLRRAARNEDTAILKRVRELVCD